ncbi:hypothetical protein Hanom_Chr08g00726901 [Helianthus anomalus]
MRFWVVSPRTTYLCFWLLSRYYTNSKKLDENSCGGMEGTGIKSNGFGGIIRKRAVRGWVVLKISIFPCSRNGGGGIKTNRKVYGLQLFRRSIKPNRRKHLSLSKKPFRVYGKILAQWMGS